MSPLWSNASGGERLKRRWNEAVFHLKYKNSVFSILYREYEIKPAVKSLKCDRSSSIFSSLTVHSLSSTSSYRKWLIIREKKNVGRKFSTYSMIDNIRRKFSCIILKLWTYRRARRRKTFCWHIEMCNF